jgi:putative acyl-CoA dehydrogenase
MSSPEAFVDDAVLNQPPARGDVDLWGGDPVLAEAVAREGGHGALLTGYARALGTATTRAAARDANRHPPELEALDRYGRRRDAVRFHPAYHDLLALGLGAGYAAASWDSGPGGHVTHAAMVYLASQIECGHCCPMTMTSAAVPAIAAAPGLAAVWRPKLLSRRYDTAEAPVEAKAGATLGMTMTERQGGSDVRANTTRAERDGDDWRIWGHKWFCSAPMSDGFLTLAQTPQGLGCFLVPRWLPDGANAIRLLRLKDKLGNRSNASAEIEYHGAFAHAVGPEGDGLRTILTMVHHTRLDAAMGPAGLMRGALAEAHHWVAHRGAFGRRLIDQPLMQAVLADLTLEWEGALTLGLRVARAFGEDTAEARAFARIAVALAKYLSNRRCPWVIHEALEVLGGSGYIEDSPLPMLFRESPLNGIWEGTGNVIALDVLRSRARDPLAREALAAELAAARGADRHYDAALAAQHDRWGADVPEAEARAFAEVTATLLTASLLLRHAPGPVGAAYAATRLAGGPVRTAGAAPLGDPAPILSRLGPAV